MLIALYQESEAGDADLRFQDVITKYGFAINEKWLQRLAEEWERNSYVKVDAFIGSPLKWYVEIAGPGLRYIEEKYGSKDGVGEIIAPVPTAPPGEDFLTDENGEPLQTEDGEYLTIDASPQEAPEPTTFHSSSWTGLPSTFAMDEQKSANLVALLRKAEDGLDRIGAKNAEKAMARAYIVAAQALADAPDPPADLIWEIINRANNLAGVASLFVSIIALFTAAY